ncbi:TcdA/TcdB catalytic glycosyltransferase domain-containing protein [Legionella sp. 16cNR16C]|uniref:TcdA/TcdB catalytic glycosyltransferase domain-containing protein n=1 Tax=Legionella sp. 16cNR16C TaxID=2905656 RepID=UPI001E3E83F5|nr:TcdA/TcdB catalytic glycosyltransferase domain-containing protein [Legionella sp. 16cNR16C]MCE3046239.1 glycosyltransferase [Legionella sp. 16cNR16C]
MKTQQSLPSSNSKKTQLIKDPYGLLQVSSSPQPLEDLPHLLKRHDIAKVEVESDEAPKDLLIPKRMNYIYIVNPLEVNSKNNHLATIASFKQLYPDYITTLWITSSAYTSEKLENLIQWARANKIHLLDSGVLDGHIGPNEEMYKLELLRRNYAAAADQLRLAILYHFGGIYSDVDVVPDPEPDNRLPDDLNAPLGFYIHKGEVRFTQFNQHPLALFKMAKQFKDSPESYCRMSYGTSNDFILSVKHCPIITKIQEKIASKYLTPVADLLEGMDCRDTWGSAPFDPDKPWPTRAFLKEWTIKVTGPTSLHDIHKQEIPDQNEAIDQNETFLRSFYFANELTWLNLVENQIAFPENALEIAVTALLYDLMVEPNVLRLDRYTGFLSQNQIIEVLKVLSEQYPHELEKVKFVFPFSAHLFLFDNASQFPALSASVLTKAIKSNSISEKSEGPVDEIKSEQKVLSGLNSEASGSKGMGPQNRYGFFQPVIDFFEKVNPSRLIGENARPG